jgi:hypothetical protein
MTALQKFYVYTLADPRDNKIFYIGKGTAARNYAHTHRVPRPNDGNMSPKSKMIRDILDAGHEVTSIIVERFAEEQDAYDYEAELIEQTPDLLNSMAGGSGRKADPNSDGKKYGLTSKQEKFSQLVAAGKLTYSDCYREAYEASGMTDKQINEEACVLHASPKITQRVELIRAPIIKKTQVVYDDIISGLQRASNIAEQTAQPAAMVSALRELGKLIDAYPAEKKEISINDDMIARIQAGRQLHSDKLKTVDHLTAALPDNMERTN